MVTTRRRSQTIEPPALPPVAALTRKRKNVDDVQPQSKRKKESSAGIAAAGSAPTKPIKNKRKRSRKTRAQEQKEDTPQADGSRPAGPEQYAHIDLTNDSSSDNATARPAAPNESDEADSRYALGSKRKGKAKKPVSTARQTAELKFEEDGFEEVDKAQAAVAGASKRASVTNSGFSHMSWTAINDINLIKANKEQPPQANGKEKSELSRKTAPPVAVASKLVMFTLAEAIAVLSQYQGGTMSVPPDVDPESLQPYGNVQTGDYMSYPVKGMYHLGSIGRYGIDTIPPLPFSLTVPLSEHSFIQQSQYAPAYPPRHGLGFDGALSDRPKSTSVRRPNNYCFTFGRYKGRRMDSVPIEYLRSIREGDEYYSDKKLQQAFTDLYPRGLYESEAESYAFEKGRYKGKRLDEVPKTYLWGLLRAAKKGEVPKDMEKMTRALDVWEKRQLDLTRD